MSEFHIEVEGGKSVRLPTSGKYCDRDILVTATGEAPGSYENGFADGYSKGRMPLDYVTTASNLFYNVPLPETFSVTLGAAHIGVSSAFSCDTTFRETTGVKEIFFDIAHGSTKISMRQTFEKCRAKKLEVPFAKTGRVSNFYRTFASGWLQEIVTPLNLENTTAPDGLFLNAESLVEVRFVAGTIKLSIGFIHSSRLSDASIQSIIDGLADLTGQTAQTLTFHATVGAKLTDAQKATITAKNWTLVY